MVVSLDAEKVFDHLEWGFIFKVLDHFGLGGLFTQWVKLLYASPQAVVVSNGITSTPLYQSEEHARAASHSLSHPNIHGINSFTATTITVSNP